MLDHLIGSVSHLGHWGYLVIFLVVALECQALLGLFMPGESLVLLGGFFSEQGLFDPGLLIGVVAGAAILGAVLVALLVGFSACIWVPTT